MGRDKMHGERTCRNEMCRDISGILLDLDVLLCRSQRSFTVHLQNFDQITFA